MGVFGKGKCIAPKEIQAAHRKCLRPKAVWPSSSCQTISIRYLKLSARCTGRHCSQLPLVMAGEHERGSCQWNQLPSSSECLPFPTSLVCVAITKRKITRTSEGLTRSACVKASLEVEVCLASCQSEPVGVEPAWYWAVGTVSLGKAEDSSESKRMLAVLRKFQTPFGGFGCLGAG